MSSIRQTGTNRKKLEELRQADLELVRRALEPLEVPDLSLERRRAVARVSTLQAESVRTRAVWFSAPVLAAAACLVCVIGVFAVLNTVTPPFSGANLASSGSALEGNTLRNGIDSIRLVSYATPKGIVLEWDGQVETSFNVLKSKNRKDFSDAAASRVEGNSWIDPSPGEPGCVYYRVEKNQAKRRDSMI